MIRQHNLDPEVASLLSGDVPRRQLHVTPEGSGNVDYLQDVIPRGRLFYTGQSAMAEQRAYDDIIVWPGNYNEIGALTLNEDGVRVRAAMQAPSMGMCRRTTFWQDSSTTGNVGVFDIQGVHHCEISGFRIGPYLGADGVGINIGTTDTSHGTFIHDNFFYTTETTNMPTYIEMGVSGSYDAQSTLIYRNDFYGGGCNVGDSAIIRWDQATRSRVMENTFMQLGNGTTYIGIKCYATVSRGWILNNVFSCMEVGGVLGISVGATTDGHLFIDGNHFIGHTAVGNCFDWDADNAGLNYLGHTAISS